MRDCAAASTPNGPMLDAPTSLMNRRLMVWSVSIPNSCACFCTSGPMVRERGSPLRGGVLELGEHSEIGPIFALRRKLKKPLDGGRVVMEAVAGIGRELPLDSQLQSVIEAVFQFGNSILAVADREIVFELELVRLDDRAAYLEIVSFRWHSTCADRGRQTDRADRGVMNAAHEPQP